MVYKNNPAKINPTILNDRMALSLARNTTEVFNNKIVRECDHCGNYDTINSISGLCPSCENKLKGGLKE